MVCLCFLLDLLIKVLRHIHFLIFGKMLLWYQFKNPIRVPHYLTFVPSLFFLFFLKFWKGLFMIRLFMIRLLIILMYTTFFQAGSLVFMLGILPKMCCCMSVIHGSGQYVGAIFLDLAKAFDCVNHDILLQKLDHYGIKGGAYEWMKSFLCGRTQQVCVQNTFSSRGWVTVGVPQGSILGPLLFSIYVNDLPNSVNTCDINMYADDTELYYCCSHL